jgi:hypothetical protein
MKTRLWARAVLVVGLSIGVVATRAQAAACEARSGPVGPVVVELYTSEGCSSCPPADRWLSTLLRHPEVVALSFHVGYWDRLGWPDRFAQPVFTERQRALMASSGARYVYTPQVLVNGQDWRQWPQLPVGRQPAVAELALQREGAALRVRIGPRLSGHSPASPRWTGYWALVEDGHRSEVRAGENAGEKLRHDHVVRQFEPLAHWSADQEQRWQWTPKADGELPRGVVRRVVFVLVDASTQRPLQALMLTC